MKMMMIYIVKMMVLVEMVGIIIVMVERIKIKKGEMVGLALGCVGGLLFVYGSPRKE